MAFDVNAFKANGLSLGGARPNLFQISLTFPSFVPIKASATSTTTTGAASTQTSQKLSFLARAASVPPAVVDDVQVPYFGRMIKMAGDRTFPDWEITILNDEDFAMRTAFETWNNKLNDMIRNTMDTQAYPLGYKTDAEVQQFSKSGPVIASYSFQGVWPKVVEAMQLDWGQQNTIQEFNVTLAYDLWTLGTGSSSGTSGF